MLQTHSPLYPPYKRIRSILTQIFFFPIKTPFSTETAIENSKTPSFSDTNQAHEDLSTSNFSGIVKSVISKCSHIWDANEGEKFTSLSLKDYILRLSNINPGIVRRFWRVSKLKPEDVLEILLGFESKGGKCDIEAKKVEYLWEIFKFASEQTRELWHLPQSCKLMASMLVRVGLFRELDYFLSWRESRELLLDYQEVFSILIEGYVGEFELERAVSVYERMRRLNLVPSMSSYHALLRYLVEINGTELMHQVYVDMIGMGMKGSVDEMSIHENVIRVLCLDGKMKEARALVKKVMHFGIRPSNLVINAVVCGYCAKKDYDDLLSFFVEVETTPDVLLGNKILFSLCKNFGVEQASMLLQKLEELGFCPDETSLGILIGSSCSEGKLKNAFFYISDIMSEGLKPHVYSYHALLGGMFKEGMWMHTRDILVEMKDMGVTPNFSTYRVLMAGFCKARQFDEMKAIVREMADHNLVQLSPFEDPLTKGFTLLGLSPLTVKIRRDNDKGLSKTEFFDKLGNGLYLDTDLDEYEKRIIQVLDDAMMPNFNSYMIEKLHSRDIKDSLIMVDEMKRWGQEMSLTALSSLFSCLSRAPFGIEIINHHFEVMTISTYQLDQKTLNMLVQTFSRKGFSFRARTMFDGMVRRGYAIDHDTYTALLFNVCKKGDLRSLHYYVKLARRSNWSPELKGGKALLGYLCKNKWHNEALELFETMHFLSSSDILSTYHSLLKALCCQGFTTTACALLDEFSNQAVFSDHIAYSHVFNGFCLEKRFLEAVKIFETMVSMRLSPPKEASIWLISQLCRINYEKTVELKNICLKDQLPVHCAYINGLCKARRIGEATSLFKEGLLKGLVPDADVFNTLIEGYCGENNLKKVLEFLGIMIRKNLSISSSSYSNMVRLACTRGKFSVALSLNELMLLVTVVPELVLYNILIFHVSSMQNSSLLNAVIDKKGLQFDDVTYNFAIRGFLLCGDVSCSLNYMKTMIRQDHRPSNRSLRGVITCLCQNGEVGPTLDLSREMEQRGWVHGSVIQSSIVQALLSKGNLYEAVQFLDRIALKELIPDNIKYDTLIKQFYHHHRLDKAVDLLNIMLSRGSSPESSSYDYVIQGFCDRRKLDIALDFHTEMLYRDLKPSMITWDTLIRRLSECSRLEEAENLLKSMIMLGETPSREAFNCVIDKYRLEKNVGKTSELLKEMQQKGYEPNFDTHWSLISNLSNSSKKDGSNGKSSFLSSLLSGFGFADKTKNSKIGDILEY
ncbi:hypothetical protein ACS0TY_006798 [Phlomoides rotata]